jgi:hypothetical protein
VDWAGLYCFTTRKPMRGRGLASALVRMPRTRGIERTLLQATALGRPVYAQAGYQEVRSLPLLRSTLGASELRPTLLAPDDEA